MLNKFIIIFSLIKKMSGKRGKESDLYRQGEDKKGFEERKEAERQARERRAEAYEKYQKAVNDAKKEAYKKYEDSFKKK